MGPALAKATDWAAASAEEPAFAAELHAGLEGDQRPETALPDRGRVRAGERTGPTASLEACG
jgi:hypothetical protein